MAMFGSTACRSEVMPPYGKRGVPSTIQRPNSGCQALLMGLRRRDSSVEVGGRASASPRAPRERVPPSPRVPFLSSSSLLARSPPTPPSPPRACRSDAQILRRFVVAELLQHRRRVEHEPGLPRGRVHTDEVILDLRVHANGVGLLCRGSGAGAGGERSPSGSARATTLPRRTSSPHLSSSPRRSRMRRKMARNCCTPCSRTAGTTGERGSGDARRR